MIIDLTRCNGCYNCQIACKDEHVGNDFLPYAKAQPREGHLWMRIEEKERGQYPRVLMTYIPIPCLHCHGEAPCVAADKDGALRRRSDGIVLIDSKKAGGKRDSPGASRRAQLRPLSSVTLTILKAPFQGRRQTLSQKPCRGVRI